MGVVNRGVIPVAQQHIEEEQTVMAPPRVGTVGRLPLVTGVAATANASVDGMALPPTAPASVSRAQTAAQAATLEAGKTIMGLGRATSTLASDPAYRAKLWQEYQQYLPQYEQTTVTPEIKARIDSINQQIAAINQQIEPMSKAGKSTLTIGEQRNQLLAQRVQIAASNNLQLDAYGNAAPGVRMVSDQKPLPADLAKEIAAASYYYQQNIVSRPLGGPNDAAEFQTWMLTGVPGSKEIVIGANLVTPTEGQVAAAGLKGRYAGVTRPDELVPQSAPLAMMSLKDYETKLRAEGYTGDVTGYYSEFLRSNQPVVVNASIANLERAGVINNGMVDVEAARTRGLSQDLINIGITQTNIGRIQTAAAENRRVEAANKAAQQTYEQQVGIWLQGQVDRGFAKSVDQAQQQLAEVQSGKFLAFQPDVTEPENVSKGKFVTVWSDFVAQREAAGLNSQQLGEIASGRYQVPDAAGKMVSVAKDVYQKWDAQQKILTELQPYRILLTPEQFASGKVQDSYRLTDAVRAGVSPDKLRSVFGTASVDRALAAVQQVQPTVSTKQEQKRWTNIATGDLYTDSERTAIVQGKPAMLDQIVRTSDSLRADLASSSLSKLQASIANIAPVKPLAELATNPIEKAALSVVDNAYAYLRGVSHAGLSAIVGTPLLVLGLAVDPVQTVSGTATGIFDAAVNAALASLTPASTAKYQQLGADTLTLGLAALTLYGAAKSVPAGFEGKVVSGLKRLHYDQSGYIELPGTPKSIVEQVSKMTEVSKSQAADLEEALSRVQNAITERSPYQLYDAGKNLHRIASEIDSKPLTAYADDIMDYPQSYVNQTANAVSRMAPADIAAKLQRVEDVTVKQRVGTATVTAADVGMTKTEFSDFLKQRVSNPDLTVEQFKTGKAVPTTVSAVSVADAEASVQDLTNKFNAKLKTGQEQASAYDAESRTILQRIVDERTKIKSQADIVAAKRAESLQAAIKRLSEKPIDEANAERVGTANLQIRQRLQELKKQAAALEQLQQLSQEGMEAGYGIEAYQQIALKAAQQLREELQHKLDEATQNQTALQQQLQQTTDTATQTALRQQLAEQTATATALKNQLKEATQTQTALQTKTATQTQTQTATQTATQTQTQTDVAVLVQIQELLALNQAAQSVVATQIQQSTKQMQQVIGVLENQPTKGRERDVVATVLSTLASHIDQNKELLAPEVPPSPPVKSPPPTEKPPTPETPPQEEIPPPPPPPPPYLIMQTGTGVPASQSIPVGAIAWRQGAFWKYIPPPWNQPKPITLPRGVTPTGAKLGGRTPAETVQVMGKSRAAVPKSASINLGIVNVEIDNFGRTIRFAGHGQEVNVGSGSSFTQGMSIPSKGLNELDADLIPGSPASSGRARHDIISRKRPRPAKEDGRSYTILGRVR